MLQLLSTLWRLSYFDQESNGFKLKIMESLLIARGKPLLSKADPSLPSVLFWYNMHQWLSHDVLSYHIIPIYPTVRIQHCVKCVQIFVPLRIQSECGKIRTRKNSVFGDFSRSAIVTCSVFNIMLRVLVFFQKLNVWAFNIISGVTMKTVAFKC